jgi:hypothetical protein
MIFYELFREKKEAKGKYITVGAEEGKKGRHVYLKPGEKFDPDKFSKNWKKEKKPKESFKDKIKRITDEYAKSITEKEKYAIRNYTGKGYIDINGYLRLNSKKNNFQPQYLSSIEELKNRVKLIDNVINKSPLHKDMKLFESKELYRGASIHDPKLHDSILDGSAVGKTFIEKAYTNASVEKSIAKNFILDQPHRDIIFVINAKKGLKAAPLEQFSYEPDEKEYLIKRNTKYKITKIKKEHFSIQIKKHKIGKDISLVYLDVIE